MSEAEKDDWNLMRAYLARECEQPGFLATFTGGSVLDEIPDLKQIDEFCRRVKAGELCLEYESHYYEFDEEGRYLYDWKSQHNDPSGIMDYMYRILDGCHKLCVMDKYEKAAEILNKVARMEFQMEGGPDISSIWERWQVCLLSGDTSKKGEHSVHFSG